jgi:ribosomal protein S1
MKRNNPISGRVGRSLQRAGICVLLGGFTAFLPYKEYSQRNALISTKEADFQSFQILSMKHANLNCVLSKDRVTYSYDRE